MKRLLFLLPLLFLPVQAHEDDPIRDKLQDFGRKWNALVLAYEGCPRDYHTNTLGILQDCPGPGELDVKAWAAARRSAEKLFDLVPAP